MEQVVYFAGWVFLTCIALAAVLFGIVVVLRYWPIRATFITQSMRAKHGHPPVRIDWQFRDMSDPVTAIMGLSSRGKTRWFFGLMLFGKDPAGEA